MISPLARTACAAGLGLALATVAATPAAAQSSARSWHGTYEYTETIPRSGGVTGVIEYRLILSPSGCQLRAQGVMTNLNARCTTRRSGNTIQVAFAGHRDGAVRDRRYRPGTQMLRLTRTPRGLVTDWQALTPSDARRRSGRYFERLR